MAPRTRAVTAQADDPNALLNALLALDSSFARRLLAGGRADQVVTTGPGGLTTLHAAVIGGCDASVLPALVEAGGRGLLDAPLSTGIGADGFEQLRTLLHERLSSAGGWRAAVRGYTPLACAIGLLDVPAVGQLLKLGAEPAAGSHGQSALAALLTFATSYCDATSAGKVAALLLRRGVDCLQWVESRQMRLADVSVGHVADACLAQLERRLAAGSLQLGWAAAASALCCAARRGHMRLLAHGISSLEPFYAAGAAADAEAAELPPAERPRTGLPGILSAALHGTAPAETVPALLASQLPFRVSGPSHRAIQASWLGDAAVKCPALVPLLHSRGAQLTAEDVLFVVDAFSVEGLAALLALGPPPTDTSQPAHLSVGEQSFSCPIHRLLRRCCPHHNRYGLEANHYSPVRMLELLLGAGLRPAVWHNVAPPPFLYLPARPGVLAVFDPFETHPPTLHSRLVFVARGGAWSPANHHHWPPAFKAAARTLLLAAHRSAKVLAVAQPGTSQQARSARQAGRLGALPAELLLNVLGQAAAPMSSWLPVTR